MFNSFQSGIKGFILVSILVFSVIMFMISLPYFAMDKHANIDFLKTKLNVYHIDYWRIGFYTHIFTSVLVLVAGATQFSVNILRKRPMLHRYMGFTYIIVLLFFSGPGAFVMGMHANGGPPAQMSFMMLTPLWMGFTLMAWQYVRKKDYIAHGEFMLRSYALTFSAITLRLYLFLIHYLQLDIKPLDKYILVSWLSWVPNMIIAEIIIRNGYISRMMKRKLKS